jgi:hypothetical protein
VHKEYDYFVLSMVVLEHWVKDIVAEEDKEQMVLNILEQHDYVFSFYIQ